MQGTFSVPIAIESHFHASIFLFRTPIMRSVLSALSLRVLICLAFAVRAEYICAGLRYAHGVFSCALSRDRCRMPITMLLSWRIQQSTHGTGLPAVIQGETFIHLLERKMRWSPLEATDHVSGRLAVAWRRKGYEVKPDWPGGNIRT